MTDAQSRVTIQFVGADAGLSATAGAINTQLGSIAASAVTLTGRLSELNQASQNYAAGLKTSSSSTSELEKANDRLAKQDLTLLFRQQAKEAQALAAAQKQAETEAQKLAAAQQKLAQSQAKEQLKAENDILKALAQSEKAAAQEAEKLFQTNAKFSQQKISEELEKQRQGYQTLAVGSGAVTAGLLELGKSALDAETKLNSAQTKVATISTDAAGLSTVLRGVSDDLKNQVSTTDLLTASYDILSSGFADNASAAEITKQSVLGATAGFSDAGTVGNALTSVLNAYKLSAGDAASVTDKLVATQNAGKITVDEYARQIGKLAPLAAQAGVGLDELNGFVATATLSGVQSEAAFTGLRQGIAAVLKPSSDATKEAAKLGIAFDAQALKTKGLSGILKELKDKSADTPEILLKLFGSVEAVTAIAPSAGEGFKKLQENIDASKNSAGEAQKAFDTVSGSLENQTKQTLNKINEALTVIGSDIAPAIGSVVGVAGQLVDVFLKLPAPIQGVLIASTAFVGVLAAATLAIAAYKIASETLSLTAAASTLATIAEAAATGLATGAKFLFTTQITAANVQLAISEGRLALGSAATFLYTAATEGATVALGGLSTALLTVVAPLAVLAAGVAVVGIVKLTEAIADQNNALEDLRLSTDQVLQAGIGAETKLKAAIDARNESKRTGIALSQQQIDKERETLEQADGSLKLLKQQLAEAEKVPKVESNLFRDALDTFTTGTIGLDGSFKKADTADAQNKAREANIASIKQQIEAIEAGRKALEGETAATDANTKGKKSAKDQAKDLKEDQQDAKAKEAADFQGKQRDEAQAQQDAEREKDLKYQDEKQVRTTAFQEAQEAIDRENERAKEERTATFQAQQTAIDRQNQLDAQARQTAYDEEKAKKDQEREAAKTKRSDTLKDSQTDAGKLLGLESARGVNRQKLSGEARTQTAVDQLDDSSLLGKDGKALSPEELAALAKKTAGLGSINNARDQEQAQFALKALSARQDKLLKDQERKEDEAYKAKVKADDLKFKADQQKIDDQKADEKKVRERTEKQNEEKIKDQLDDAKKARKQAEDLKERGLDRQHEEDKREATRAFNKQQKDDETTFKADQRQKDRENAEAIKKIIESAKVEAPKPAPSTPAPKNVGSNPIADVNFTPRFTGGPVVPGQTYLGGEGGVERIDFGGGRDALVGSNGPQLFRVDRPGYVHPHTSAYTQAVVQTAHYQHQSVGRSPVGQVSQSTPVIYRDDAMLSELRALRSEVGALRSVTQNYHIETKNPMEEVYKSQKIAARTWR